MTGMTVFQLRVPVGEKEGWRVCAVACGLSLSEWVRSVLDEEVVMGPRVSSGEEMRGEGVVREPVVRVSHTLAVGKVGPTVDGGPALVRRLAESVPGVAVGVDHRARREAGLFDEGCLRSVAHRGGVVCGLCGGDRWV